MDWNKVRSGFKTPSRAQSQCWTENPILEIFPIYCGWPFLSALTLSPIVGFETTSKGPLQPWVSILQNYSADEGSNMLSCGLTAQILSIISRSYLKNAFCPNLCVGSSFQLLGILEYACGLNLGPALTLNRNPIFEIASGWCIKEYD